MREAVRRACVIIRRQRFTFTAEEKSVTYKTDVDYVTSADKEAQDHYLDFLSRNFPKFGVIAEEDELFMPAKEFIDYHDNAEHFFYFTIDPLDGTNAYKRMQSDSYSSMLSLIHSCPRKGINEVIAVCIGDPMTNELYYTRPESPRVHQLSMDGDQGRKLEFNPNVDHAKSYLLTRDNQGNFSSLMQSLGNDPIEGLRFFKDIEIMGGSIGISYAKLWKGQCGGLILKAGTTTVWDTAPVYGICKKLGFVQLVNGPDGLRKEPFHITTVREEFPQMETLVVHESLVPSILAWSDMFKKTVA